MPSKIFSLFLSHTLFDLSLRRLTAWWSNWFVKIIRWELRISSVSVLNYSLKQKSELSSRQYDKQVSLCTAILFIFFSKSFSHCTLHSIYSIYVIVNYETTCSEPEKERRKIIKSAAELIRRPFFVSFLRHAQHVINLTYVANEFALKNVYWSIYYNEMKILAKEFDLLIKTLSTIFNCFWLFLTNFLIISTIFNCFRQFFTSFHTTFDHFLIFLTILHYFRLFFSLFLTISKYFWLFSTKFSIIFDYFQLFSLFSTIFVHFWSFSNIFDYFWLFSTDLDEVPKQFFDHFQLFSAKFLTIPVFWLFHLNCFRLIL
jgi:hypothetical protein